MRKLVYIILMCAAATMVWAYDNAQWDQDARQRKAEYLFLEAENACMLEEYDRYAMLMQRAYALDSSDLDIAYGWGTVAMALSSTDSLTYAKAYQYAKDRFYSDPDNYVMGMMLGGLARRQRDFKELVRVWETLDSTHPELNQPLEELANAYLISYVMGDTAAYDKAIAIFDRMEMGNGKSVDLSSKKIQAYSVKQDTAAVINEIEALSQFAPHDAVVALFVGGNYQYLNDNQKALEYYNRACALDSTLGNAFMARANIYHEMGDSVGFDREVFQALHSPNLEVDSKLEILRGYVAELFRDRSQEPRIRELFGELENMHSGEADIHNLYAAYLYEIEDYAGAADEMTYSVALEPTSEGAWNTLLQMLARAKDNDRMLVYGKDAHDRFPKNLYYPICIAEAYRDKGDTAKAIATIDSVEISGNTPQEASFVSYKGDIYAWAGDTIKALETYDLAIDMNPNNLMALNNAAYFMATSGGDLDKAERYISQVIAQESDNPTYMDTYAWVFFKKKDYNMARQYIDITLRLCEGMSTDSTAEEDSMEVVPGNSPEVLAEAIENIEEEEQDDNKKLSADVLEHAGDIYFMNGEPDQALEFWKRALAMAPDNELLQRKVKHKTYFYK